MAPIIAALAKWGLGTLATAVLSKGKDAVQEKLGIDIDAALGSEEGRLKLKQLELEHEQFLISAAQASETRDLDYFREEGKDRDSARRRDAEFVKAGRWNFRADAMFVLALMIVSWLVWIVWKDDSINEYVKGIFTLVLGRFLGYLDNIYNFEFGTTRNSRTKDESIAALSSSRKGGEQ